MSRNGYNAFTSTPVAESSGVSPQPLELDLSSIEGSNSDRILYSEELFNTPESDESDNSDEEDERECLLSLSDSEDEDDIETIVPTDHSMLTESQVISEPGDSENDVDIVYRNGENVQWDWVNDDSLASHAPFEFNGESRWMDLSGHTENYELNYFLEYFTDEVLDMIVLQTNKYHQEVLNSPATHGRRIQKFKPANSEDIMRLIATRICMGLDQKPKQTDYWSSNPFYTSGIVPKIMTSERYKEVLRFLHFCDNTQQQEGDRLHKVRTIWDMVMERIQFMYTPGKNICIDESLVLYKGKLFFKQYIPSKASRFGIKIFSVADSTTGYILNSIVYQGAGHQFAFPTADFGFGGAVALHLALPYLNSGRCLYIDNYISNARVARELLLRNTNMCGTLRKRLKHNPDMRDRVQTDHPKLYSCNGILVERWKDKKEVRMISTGIQHHMNHVTTRCGVEKFKPQTVLLYNKNARSVDKSDMVIGHNDLLRKTTKWYKKLFFHLIDVCLYNASIMYGMHHRKVPMINFKEAVVRQILNRYGEHNVKRGRKRKNDFDYPQAKRLVDRHFPSHVPPTAKNNFPTRDCVVCKKKGKRLGNLGRRQVRYQCVDCDVGLCVDPCFKIFHEKLNY